jgi:predicted GNAT family N-acyltransferase
MAEAAQRGMRRLALSAQTHAVDFYARFGFVPEGPEYQEAGLPHQAMERLAD